MAKLVAIGDSLTQGFRSLAMTDGHLSIPAMIAERMGIRDFRTPDFTGEGGLPFNLEWAIRHLDHAKGPDLAFTEWPAALLRLADLMDRVEDFWERGEGARPGEDVLFHNLAIWGYEVSDAYLLTPAMCRKRIDPHARDNWFSLPSEPRLRSARRVLNPADRPEREQDTQIGVAKRIRERDGGIDHLTVWLGANNCLAAVVELDIRETGKSAPGPISGCTLWTPDVFAMEYRELARRIESIGARHVYLATVPHITIPPVSRGVGEFGDRYFEYYTRQSIPAEDFDARLDPCLRREQVMHIDDYIDGYNATIRDVAGEHGWSVVDISGMLDRLAFRRNEGRPTYPMPSALQGLDVRAFETTSEGRVKQGGLVSLDGVHPTVCGYALIAQEFIEAMKPYEPGLRDMDFAEIRTRDTLVSNPPRILDDMAGFLKLLEKKIHISRWLGAPRT